MYETRLGKTKENEVNSPETKKETTILMQEVHSLQQLSDGNKYCCLSVISTELPGTIVGSNHSIPQWWLGESPIINITPPPSARSEWRNHGDLRS